LSLIIYRILSDSRIRYRSVGARLESGGRRDSSAKRLESERMPYARQGALLWGSLVSCGRLAIGQLPRLHGIAAVANRRAGCQPAPRHGSGSTFMSRTRLLLLHLGKAGKAEMAAEVGQGFQIDIAHQVADGELPGFAGQDGDAGYFALFVARPHFDVRSLPAALD